MDDDVQVTLLAWPTKIGSKSVLEVVFVVLEHVAHLGNLRLPKLDGPGPT